MSHKQILSTHRQILSGLHQESIGNVFFTHVEHATSRIKEIHFSVDGRLSCFHVIAIVDSAMNAGEHVSFGIMVFSRYLPSSGIAGFNGELREHYSMLCDNLNKKKIQKRGDILICICMADSLRCTVDTNMTL